jgi:two-component system KDP operon response regulator KdpE
VKVSQATPRILLVEDDPAICDVLAVLFETNGFIALPVDTCQSARGVAREQRPDVCIIDLGLPDGDGIELIRHVRSWSPVPILILTARTQEPERLVAFEAGADDYITKPFSGMELIARVRAILRRVTVRDRPTVLLRLGGTLVNMEERVSVRPGGEVQKLTPLEHRILECLAHQPDCIVTHGEIMKEVWGSHDQADIRSLRVYVASLRRKLETDPAQPQHILTEVGVGYRLVLDPEDTGSAASAPASATGQARCGPAGAS